ncbi:uncharacterized protein V5649_018945 [Rhynchonycteris naso]
MLSVAARWHPELFFASLNQALGVNGKRPGVGGERSGVGLQRRRAAPAAPARRPVGSHQRPGAPRRLARLPGPTQGAPARGWREPRGRGAPNPLPEIKECAAAAAPAETRLSFAARGGMSDSQGVLQGFVCYWQLLEGVQALLGYIYQSAKQSFFFFFFSTREGLLHPFKAQRCIFKRARALSFS